MSSCVRNSQVTISMFAIEAREYSDTPIEHEVLEFLPQSLKWNTRKNKFDSARAKAGSKVRNAIKPHTINGDKQTIFEAPVPTKFKINGKTAKYMVLYADGIRISRDSISLEFRDPLKYLKNGDVSVSYGGQSFKDIYKTAFEAVNSSVRIFKGLKFNMDIEKDVHVPKGMLTEVLAETKEQRQNELENNQDLIVSRSNLEFEHSKPIEVFNTLNNELGMESWITTNGYLKVGNRTTSSQPYITAPDDNRVLYMNDYSISAPKNPIKAVIVRGNVADEPSDGGLKNATEFIDPRRGHENEFRSEGYATNTNIDFGEVKTINADVGAEGAEALAVSKLIEMQRDQWDGSISINPEKSGTAVGDVRDIQIGDTIGTVPPDETKNGCWSSVWVDKYRVAGVNHDFSGSHWTLDLTVYPINDGYLNKDNLTSGTRYMNRENKKYMSGDAYRNKNEDSGVIGDLTDAGHWTAGGIADNTGDALDPDAWVENTGSLGDAAAWTGGGLKDAGEGALDAGGDAKDEAEEIYDKIF